MVCPYEVLSHIHAKERWKIEITTWSLHYSLSTLCNIKCNNNKLHLQQDTVLYLFNNTESLSSSVICGIFLQDFECSIDDPSLEWTVDVDLGPKPTVKRSDNTKAEVSIILKVQVKLLNEKGCSVILYVQQYCMYNNIKQKTCCLC